ncbi:MAG: hypothetical protein MUC49_00095 [Raineya sp.]|jgi:hypothetical protein|nr:hypothetical protein [Raineya sp.]
MKLIILLLTLCFSTSSFAQRKVEHIKKKDEILVDGVKWATAKSLPGNGTYQRIIAVRDVTGKEVVYGKIPTGEGNGYYEIQFVQSGRIAYKAPGRFNITRDLAIFLVEYEALTKEGFSTAGEDKIMSLFNNPPTLPVTNTPSQYVPIEQPNPNTTNPNTTVNPSNSSTDFVDRNRQTMVFVSGNRIQQDSKNIGTIEDKSQAINGEIVITYIIKNHLNITVGEATAKMNSQEVKLITFKDNQVHNINTPNGYIRSDTKRSIAQYLNEKYYW